MHLTDHRINTPQIKIVPIEKNIKNVVVNILMAFRSPQYTEVDMITYTQKIWNDTNPITILFPQYFVISEYITGEPCKEFPYKQFGMFDADQRPDGYHNCITSNTDNKNYVIDTETMKNFYDGEFISDNIQTMKKIHEVLYGIPNLTITNQSQDKTIIFERPK